MKNLVYLFSVLLLVTGCFLKSKPEIPVAGNMLNDSLKITQLNDVIGITDNTIVCDTMQRDDDNLFAFGTFISLPKLFSKTGEYEILNRRIATDFDSVIRAASVNPKGDKDEYHRISYNHYLHDSILTLKITDLYARHLSEATTSFSVYHFDYKNNKLLNTQEMFAAFGLSQVPVLSAFAEQCTMPPDNTDPLFNTDWFNKVKFNDINQLKFYMDNDKKIAIIYPVAENGIEGELTIE